MEKFTSTNIDLEIEKWHNLHQDLLSQYSISKFDNKINESNRTILKSILDHIELLKQKSLMIKLDPLKWMDITDQTAKYNIGDVVITNGYCEEYDHRELTITNIEEFNQRCFYYFNVNDGGYYKSGNNFIGSKVVKKKIIKS